MAAGHRIELEPRYVEAQGPILSFKVPFVKIGAADWTFTGDNHFWQSCVVMSLTFGTITQRRRHE